MAHWLAHGGDSVHGLYQPLHGECYTAVSTLLYCLWPILTLTKCLNLNCDPKLNTNTNLTITLQ